MNLDPLQLLLQLGAIGAVLFVVWKIGSKWIDRQGETEKDRTAAISDGFKAITTSLNAHHTADIASHERLAESHNEVRLAVTRLEGRIDGVLDWQERTPVEAPRPAQPRTAYALRRPGTKEGSNDGR